jgi:protein tyrosine phosphatase (PTP) superfamily phosphohydrolase (DUF442 family)
MARALQVAVVGGLAFLALGVAPFVYFRSVYAHQRRLRVVEPGKLYRSGQLTADGFEEVVERYGIRTVLNVQDDHPDPDVSLGFWGTGTVKESELCRRLGVRFLTIKPDLVSWQSGARPGAVDAFLALMDRPDVYPVLIHCKAGLHRTGILSAVYRMEYQGWSPDDAYRELKAHGFGDRACTSANEYVRQYVLDYRPGLRRRTNAQVVLFGPGTN